MKNSDFYTAMSSLYQLKMVPATSSSLFKIATSNTYLRRFPLKIMQGWCSFILEGLFSCGLSLLTGGKTKRPSTLLILINFFPGQPVIIPFQYKWGNPRLYFMIIGSQMKPK